MVWGMWIVKAFDLVVVVALVFCFVSLLFFFFLAFFFIVFCFVLNDCFCI